MNLIDLAAVLPFWVILFVNAANPNSNASGSFGFVRVIRLVRVFRVFKFGRYSIGLQMFAGALKGSVQPMGILVFVMSINMIIVSSVVHIVELAIPDEDQSEAHLRCFGTIARTFWWSMVTMTTVGYGDCSPLSPLGKVFAVVAMLSGVLILALPITVIGSNFAKMVEMFEEDNAAYTLTDGDGDGLVDEFELREFIVRKKKEGALQKNVDTKVANLMAKYDPQGNGTLSKQEFTALQRDIINPSSNDPFADIHEMSEKVAANAENFVDVTHMIEARLGAVEFLLTGIGKQMGMPSAATDALNHPKNARSSMETPVATPAPATPGAGTATATDGAGTATDGAGTATATDGTATATATDGTATDGSQPGTSLAPSPPPPAHLYESLPVPASIFLPASTLGPTALRGETSGSAGSSQPHRPFALSAARPVAPRAGAVQLQPLGAGSGALPPPPRPQPPKLDQSSDRQSSSTNGR